MKHDKRECQCDDVFQMQKDPQPGRRFSLCASSTLFLITIPRNKMVTHPTPTKVTVFSGKFGPISPTMSLIPEATSRLPIAPLAPSFTENGSSSTMRDRRSVKKEVPANNSPAIAQANKPCCQTRSVLPT